MRVSFDFDRTLNTLSVRKYAKELIDRGIEVWITTARFKENTSMFYDANYSNTDLYHVAESLNIPKDRITFMNMVQKSDFLECNEDFIFHLDDDYDEISYVKPIWVYSFTWREDCNRLILENEQSN